MVEDKKMASKEMIRAAKQGDVERMRALLAEDPSMIGVRDSDGSTPLHCAAWKGHMEAVRLLLESGADVGAKSENGHYGDTPLHAAAHGNQRAAAQLLIDHGADIQAVSFVGRTPLQETAIHNATSVSKLLKERGAKE